MVKITPREKFENRVGRDVDSQLKASTSIAVTTDKPGNCDDKFSWNLQKIRTTLIGYLEKAHKANPGYICHRDYVSLRAISSSLDAVDSFTKPKPKCKNPWAFGNVPSYRKWATTDNKKPKKQLIDMIGTLIELIPVGCQIPAKFKNHYGDRVVALRGLIAVPNGLLPMLQGKIPGNLNDSAGGNVSDNGYFISNKSPPPTASKPRAAQSWATALGWYLSEPRQRGSPRPSWSPPFTSSVSSASTFIVRRQFSGSGAGVHSCYSTFRSNYGL